MIPALPFPRDSSPHIAILRFSALGDVVLVAEAVRQLHVALPNASITWITSPLTHALLKGMEGIEFEVFDKPRSLADYRYFYRTFKHRRFDAVLAMQANLRINLLYPALHAPIKIGFDCTRAREGQWLFTNQRIPYHNEHLLDSFLSFVHALGCDMQPVEWSLPISEDEMQWVRTSLQNLPKPLIAIHPCASKPERNWPLLKLEALIHAAKQRWQCGFVFTGGSSAHEVEICRRLTSLVGDRGLNLCGRTTPKQLAALLGEVDVLIAPDTSAVHLARAMNTPVIGLYAVAPPALSGPYQRDEFIVDRYPAAVRRFLGKEPAELKWNTRVHHPDAMDLIEVEDVLLQLSKVLQR